MKKIFLFWSLIAATMMFFASCNNDNIPDNTEKKAAAVKISIASSTRASSGPIDASLEESKISNIEAYVFDHEGVCISYLATTEKSATLNAQIGQVTIAVVANSSINSVATLNELKEKLSTYELDNSNSTVVPGNGFVMSGIDVVTLNEGANNHIISVKRTVSKFDAPTFKNVVLDLSALSLEEIKTIFSDFTVDDDVEDIEFEYSAFALANGLNKSLLFNDASYTSNEWPINRTGWNSLGFTYFNSEFETDGSYETDGVYSKEFIVNTPVYVHENFPYADYVVTGVTGYNPKEVYCFIIEGKLTWDGNEAIRYWRVNLVKETSDEPTGDNYRIFRNGCYKVNIDSVKSIGYGTPKEAEEEEVPVIPVDGATLINITVTPAQWDLYESNTSM